LRIGYHSPHSISGPRSLAPGARSERATAPRGATSWKDWIPQLLGTKHLQARVDFLGRREPDLGSVRGFETSGVRVRGVAPAAACAAAAAVTSLRPCIDLIERVRIARASRHHSSARARWTGQALTRFLRSLRMCCTFISTPVSYITSTQREATRKSMLFVRVPDPASQHESKADHSANGRIRTRAARRRH